MFLFSPLGRRSLYSELVEIILNFATNNTVE